MRQRVHPTPPARGLLEAANRGSVPVGGVQVRLPRRGATSRSGHGRLNFLAFLLYVLVVTTYSLPIGDVVVFLALAGLFFSKARIRFPTWFRWFTAFTLWSAVSALFSAYPDAALLGTVDLLKLWLIVLIACNALPNRQQIRVFVIFYLGCFALFPLRGAFLNYFVYGYNVSGRAVWVDIFSNANELAAIALLQASMAGFVLSDARPGWTRYAALAGTVLVPLLVVLTQSRAAFLGLTFLAFVAFASQRRRVRAVFQLGLLVLALVLATPSGVWDRVGSLRFAT